MKWDFPPTNAVTGEVPVEQEARLASPRMAEIAQQQFHILSEFLPVEEGSALELATDAGVAMEGGVGGLAASFVASWLGDRVSDDQKETLNEASAYWLSEERKGALVLPGVDTTVSAVFSGVPVTLDLAIMCPKGCWFINLLSRERLLIRDRTDDHGSLRTETEVIVFAHIARAVRLGGLSQLMATVQDAGRLTEGIGVALQRGGNAEMIEIVRDASAMCRVNAAFGFSGRKYTAVSIVRRSRSRPDSSANSSGG